MCFKLDNQKLLKKEYIVIDGYEYIVATKQFIIHKDEYNLYGGDLHKYKYTFEPYKGFKRSIIDNKLQEVETDSLRHIKAVLGYHSRRINNNYHGYNTVPILIRPEDVQLINKNQLICERFIMVDINTALWLNKKFKLQLCDNTNKLKFYCYNSVVDYSEMFENNFN